MLKRRTRLRVKRKPADPVDELRMRAWHSVVCKDSRGSWRPCAMCGSTERIQGHHTLPQQVLKRAARSAGVAEGPLLWNPQNGIPLCTHCHERHTHPVNRVPAEKLPPRCYAFAESLGLRWRLEREHPPAEPVGSAESE